ncbi:Pyroglutamylated RFamide peptide receptor [Echinococcus granulosus]|uniref:Pyroglutamylated RFamide peptide receptor n=1 Tax=Echinococcus granulosus TaxID=6210 RepID=W6UKK4_ECHGR|nr:Pyroglutamylated RFamide peptide receptor [Echinococcus granulosus]EUB61696.1 Pyroglutamylated RFamide peptide receptor [Echinococcus granulosus]
MYSVTLDLRIVSTWRSRKQCFFSQSQVNGFIPVMAQSASATPDSDRLMAGYIIRREVGQELYYELGEPSEMSATTCRVLFASLGVPTHVSCILILLIAIDRYRSVRFPTVFTSSSVTSASSTGGGGSVATGSMRSSTALLLVLLSILFSLLAAFPVAYYTDAQQVSTQTFVNDLNVSISPSTTSSLDTVAPIANDMQDKPHFPMYCVEQWPSPLRRLIYSVLVVIGQFLTPLIVTLILYAHIGWWLAHRRGQLYRMQKTSTSHIQLAARLEMRTRRTHRILVGIVACFAGCWTPWTLYSLYLECTAYAIAGVPVDEMAMVDPGSQDVAVDANLKTTDLVLKARKVGSCRVPTPSNQCTRISLLNSTAFAYVVACQCVDLFALSSTCANPFLYGWLNENIRKSIIRRTGLCKKKSTHHDQTTVISMTANYSHMDKATSKPHCPTNRKSHP